MLGYCCAISADENKITAYTEQVFPLNYTIDGEEGGEVLGYATQLVKAILDEAKVNYEINMVPWSRAIHFVDTNKNTLIYSMNRTEARENNYHWIGKIYSIRTYLYGRREAKQNLPFTLEDAKNYSIGTLRNGAVFDYLKQEGFNDLKEIKSVDRYMPLIQRKRFDLFPFFEFSMAMTARRLNIDPDEFVRLMELEGLKNDLYIAVSKQTDKALASKLQAAYERIKADGRYQQIMSPMEDLK